MANKEDEIMEAVIEIVAKKGLMEYSSKDIVAMIGCSTALIYKYFSTNDVLIKRCCERIRERHVVISKEILQSIDYTKEYWEINEDLFYNYIKRYSERPNDTLFIYALAGTKYDNLVMALDDRSNDPFFTNLMERIEVADESVMTDFLVAYDCTRIALNTIINTIANGNVPNTDDEYRKLASMLTNGIGSFIWKKG